MDAISNDHQYKARCIHGHCYKVRHSNNDTVDLERKGVQQEWRPLSLRLDVLPLHSEAGHITIGCGAVGLATTFELYGFMGLSLLLHQLPIGLT